MDEGQRIVRLGAAGAALASLLLLAMALASKVWFLLWFVNAALLLGGVSIRPQP